MTEERITSRKNPTVQQVRKLLTSRKAREAAGLFVSDGTKLLKEAAVHCPGLETAFLCDGVEVELPENVRVVRVSKEVMEAISPMETPQGAVFLCRLPEKKSFVPEKGMLLLDGSRTPETWAPSCARRMLGMCRWLCWRAARTRSAIR